MSYWGKWPGCWVNVRVLNLESAGAKGSQGWRSKPETPKYMQRPLEQDEMDGLFTWTWCSKKFISAAKVTLLKCTKSLSGAPHVALVEGACFTATQCTEEEHGTPKVKVTAYIKISSKKLVWVPANMGLIPKVRPTRLHHLLSLTWKVTLNAKAVSQRVFITDSEFIAFHTHRAHRAGKMMCLWYGRP